MPAPTPAPPSAPSRTRRYRIMRNRPLLLALLAAATLAACTRDAADAAPADPAVAGATRAGDAAPAAAPVASDYSLYDLGSSWRDQDGDSVRLEELAGKVRLVALVYTSCHATCPLIVHDLQRIEQEVARAVPERMGDVGIVLVSIDPARDTPGRLAEWAAENRLDPARWTLLNGSDAAVRELAATLGVRYQPQPDGELAHTNAITVLDATGAVAHQQLGLGEPARETAAAVAALLR